MKSLNSLSSVVGHLRLISGTDNLVLSPTTGGEGSIVSVVELLGRLFDPYFPILGSGWKNQVTTELEVQVYEVVAKGSMVEILNELREPFDSLLFTPEQIIQFVRRFSTWLHPEEGRATTFLFKFDDEYYEAGVYRKAEGRFGMGTNRLSSNGYIFHPEDRHRVVLPKLPI